MVKQSSNQEVYIVFYESGKYEDHKKLVAEVFHKEKDAKAYLDEKMKMLDELGLNAETNNDKSEDPEYRMSMKEKIGFHISFQGSWYSLEGPFIAK